MKSGQRLFTTGKVGCFVDGYGPRVEKRHGDEVTCLSVAFRVQPFDAKMATSLDSGVGGDSNIRATIFSLTTGDPKPNFTRHDFKLGLPPQNLSLFASTDTDVARVALLQARISGCYVRVQKDMNALAFCFRATFGPVDRDQLELLHSLFRSQTFITFEEGEPLLEAEVDEETDLDAAADGESPSLLDQADGAAGPRRVKDRPKKRGGGRGRGVDDNVNRRLHSHAGGKKKTAKRGSARR